MYIKLNLDGDRQIVPAIDLRPASDPRDQSMHTFFVRRTTRSSWLNNADAAPQNSCHRLRHSTTGATHPDLIFSKRDQWVSDMHPDFLTSALQATVGVSIRMVLNFGILNILLSAPTRLDQYKAGPFEVSLTNIIITKRGTSKTSARQMDRDKSNISFHKYHL